MNSSWPPSLEHFDLDHETVEKSVSERNGSYQGLKSEALYTSLADLNNIFNHPLVHGTFLDLGCGNGRSCLFYASKFPERRAIGIEFEPSRLESAQKYLKNYPLDNVTFINGDLLHDEIPKADTYFLYFPTGMVLDRILNKLYSSSNIFNLIAIESHGDLLDRLQLENWLTLKDKVPLVSQRHHPSAFIFERNSEERDSRLESFNLSFQEKFLLIKNQNESWIGETLGMEWAHDDRFELATPPRTIFWKDVLEIYDFSQINKKYREALQIRRMGEVTVKTAIKTFNGFLRKIVIEPTFHLELSGGTTVEWDEILTIHQGSKLCYDSSSDF